MSDPISVTTTLITFVTFIKDLIEVGHSIRRSIEKVQSRLFIVSKECNPASQVGENRCRIRELIDDILRSLTNLADLTQGQEDTFHGSALLGAMWEILFPHCEKKSWERMLLILYRSALWLLSGGKQRCRMQKKLQASILWKLRRQDEAVVACEEATGIMRKVSENEKYFLPDLTGALDQVVAYLSQNRDDQGAAAAVIERSEVLARINLFPSPPERLSTQDELDELAEIQNTNLLGTVEEGTSTQVEEAPAFCMVMTETLLASEPTRETQNNFTSPHVATVYQIERKEHPATDVLTEAGGQEVINHLLKEKFIRDCSHHLVVIPRVVRYFSCVESC
ncbi:hypothetical protein DFH07DRAFT_764685 [Mycena maculata]|uniref:Uncharacterized protein n=1 Tax=Mycena maculata TaxID=230809 RepID=A0AAD7KDL4_9AGAR|nr:hypothetical protein DFH07DRAFT_764685 [Mycena maculata]